MIKNINDSEYLFYISDILENEEFKKLDKMGHHGITRLEHSIRVSYYSYKIAKILKLNYETTARAGLLHDFFISNKNRPLYKRFYSIFVHPRYALENANKYFEIDDISRNIIEAHMFPIYKCVPKYAESWIVTSIDKVSAIYEFGRSFSTRFSYAANVFILLFINYLK